MDYKLLYHKLNHRRGMEIDLCYKSITTVSKLYDNVIEIYNKYQNDKQVTEMRRLCSNTCADLQSIYQALLETDTIIEEMLMDEDVKTTAVYSFELLNDNKKDTDN